MPNIDPIPMPSNPNISTKTNKVRAEDLSAPYIEIRDLHIHYPLDKLARLTLKSEVFRILSARPPEVGARQMDEGHTTYIKAINGLNLDIASGQRVALIGLNGAGKSTLLRSIAGIYRPYQGHIKVQGVMHTLFDTATGFEAHATGRDNIYFRGLVMGLTPAEIRERAKEIIEFAEIGKFIDYPLHTYSSGMSVRLAFAISSYLEGDILLIDEIFGAGDISFQKKAEARMTALMDKAKILVFASHSAGLLRMFCDRGIWLHQGEIIMDAPVEDVIQGYSAKHSSS